MTTNTLALPEVEIDVDCRVFTATSASHPEIFHTIDIDLAPDGTLATFCTCPAGRFSRPDRKPIACRHGRAVAAYLEDLGYAERYGRTYRLTIAIPSMWIEVDGES